MPYIGKNPSDSFRGFGIRDTFTGDGSTTVFDLSAEAPDGGVNDIEVFVDNVRQEPTSAYTLGEDGSGDIKRITFTAAPTAGQSIYVINPGLTDSIPTPPDNSISSGKLQNNSVTAAKLATTLDFSSGYTITLPSTFVTTTGSQTLTNKTLTTPVISSISNTGTLTLPTSTDTIVGRATTDTLTNKSISGSSNTITNLGNSALTNSVLKFADESSTVTSIPLGGTLKFNGATLSGDTLEITGGTSWQAVKTSGFTAVAGEGYFCNTTSAAFTATLPGSATQGDTIKFIDYAATFDTNNLTIGRNGHNIQGLAEDLTVSTERAGLTLVYADATQGWLLETN